MNILIAHSKPSFIEAATQMLVAQNSNYKIVGARSLSELLEKISLNSFQVSLVDSDLAKNNDPALIQILKTLREESHTIVLVREQDQLLEHIKQTGVQQTVIKSTGYLPAIANAVRYAMNGLPKNGHTQANGTPQPNPPVKPAEKIAPSTLQLSRKPQVAKPNEEGYFVCDRRGRFLSVNPVMEHITRYSLQELMQLSILDLIVDADDDGNFLRKLFQVATTGQNNSLTADLQDKFGERHHCIMNVRVLRDESSHREIIGFQVTVQPAPHSAGELQRYHIDQSRLIAEFVNLVYIGYSEPLNIFLRRIVEVVCQVFKFKRSTLALLDHRRQVFVKQAMVGYSDNDGQSIEHRTMEVPSEVIDRIFEDRYRIKVIYYNQDQRDVVEENPGVPERRTQRRRPLDEWHKRDLILLNLKDHNDHHFGYISLDEPEDGTVPTRSTFHNLELVSRLISMSIENYYRFSTLDKKNRRLKQILSNSNIFKLHLSLTELLNEVVWSAKYSLEFNLVSLVLISKKTQRLESKAVACNDKIKQTQLLELTFDIHEFSGLLKDEYQVGASYLINREEYVLEHFKQIYYGAETSLSVDDGWPNYALLLVPIRGRDGKIVGFFMADDPQDTRFPTPETVHTLEILANQIAVAIDNRIMYVQAKEPATNGNNGINGKYDRESMIEVTADEEFDDDDFAQGGFKKIVERFLR